MKINFNMSALIAANSLSQSEDGLSKSIERLSSGFKINHAKDSPSGIAIAKKMNAQIRGLSAATQNASDGISVIETAEGALAEIQSMLQRVSELGVKASTGTVTDSDREAIQKEVDQLTEEVSRVARDTEFNGKTLLDGTFDLKGYADNKFVNIEYYSDEAAGNYEVTINTDVDATGKPYIDNVAFGTGGGTVINPSYEYDDDNHTVTIKGDNNFELTLDVDLNGFTSGTTVQLNLAGFGAMTTQIGANEGQVLDVRIPTVSLKTLGIEDIDMSTEKSSQESLEKVDASITKVSAIRARLGAYQNRLEHSVASLDVTSENMTAAYSRIMDVDMAEEMTEYTKYQVLSQAGNSVLAQANERPSQVLQLLQ